MDLARAAELVADLEQRQLAAELVDEYGPTIYVYGGATYRAAAQELFGEVEEVVGMNSGCGDHFSALQELFEGAL